MTDSESLGHAARADAEAWILAGGPTSELEMPSVAAFRWQSLALELEFITSTISHATDIMRRTRWSSHSNPAVLTLLAAGVEHLLKVSHAMLEEADGKPWPTVGDMREIGHRIAELDRLVRDRIRLNLSRSTAPGHLSGLLSRIDGDPITEAFLAAIDRYARSGRYYELGRLSGEATTYDSPQAIWEQEFEIEAILTGPGLLDDVIGGGEFLRDYLAGYVERWYDLHVTAWRTGVLGSEAQRWASALDRLDFS